MRVLFNSLAFGLFGLVSCAANDSAGVTTIVESAIITDPDGPFIERTSIFDDDTQVPLQNGSFQMVIGVRYTANVRINKGNGAYKAGVEINPDVVIPGSLNVHNPVNATRWTQIRENHTRRFAIMCSQPGTFPLGFRMRDVQVSGGGTDQPFNAGAPISVTCLHERTGAYGVVSGRVLSNGRYIAGNKYVNADVRSGNYHTYTDSSGAWRLPLTGGPHRITISAAESSNVEVVNVTVPPRSGIKIVTEMEESFPNLLQHGIVYTTYIDYSEHRTIFHTVRFSPSRTMMKVFKTKTVSTPIDYLTLDKAAQSEGALVALNGGYFDVDTGFPMGYFYSKNLIYSSEHPDTATFESGVPGSGAEPLMAGHIKPLIAVKGLSPPQSANIFESERDYNVPPWGRDVSGNVIWDTPPVDGISAFDYGLQAVCYLVRPGTTGSLVAWRGDGTHGIYGDVGYDGIQPKTAVGMTPSSNTVYFVVADGEGVHGAQGANLYQMGAFMRDVLGVTVAVQLDSGNSTQMVLRGSTGYRRINMITGEDHSIVVEPPWTPLRPSNGGTESVANFLTAGGPY